MLAPGDKRPDRVPDGTAALCAAARRGPGRAPSAQQRRGPANVLGPGRTEAWACCASGWSSGSDEPMSDCSRTAGVSTPACSTVQPAQAAYAYCRASLTRTSGTSFGPGQPIRDAFRYSRFSLSTDFLDPRQNREQDRRLFPPTQACQLKAPTGISGLDEITLGGFPKGRPTLVCGAAGSGKTMLAAEFIVRGATEYDEPGVFMMFEESAEELTSNVRSLGIDLDKAPQAEEKSHCGICARVERSEIEETGEYADLEGLLHSPGSRHRLDRRQACRARHDRSALRRPAQPRHPPRGAAAPVSLAEGQGRHHRHHG